MISKVFLHFVDGSSISFHQPGYQAQFLSELSNFLAKNKIHAALYGLVRFRKNAVLFKISADRKINHGHVQYYFSAPLYSAGWRPKKGKRRVFTVSVY